MWHYNQLQKKRWPGKIIILLTIVSQCTVIRLLKLILQPYFHFRKKIALQTRLLDEIADKLDEVADDAIMIHDIKRQNSFFKFVKRTRDYDKNEVPWDGERGEKPVQVLLSAYLRKE